MTFTATKNLPLAATTTGSWPRPAWYDQSLWGRPLDSATIEANAQSISITLFSDGLRRLPALNLLYNSLSSARREPGVLVHVHPVLPRIAEASQLQLPRSEPDGQPNESSQLANDAWQDRKAPTPDRNALGRPRYLRCNALIQDAAYENLLKSRRQVLHRRVAEILRDRFADTAAAEPEVLAHHFTQAGLTDAAIEWWEARSGQRGACGSGTC
jgi:hypothetical protein